MKWIKVIGSGIFLWILMFAIISVAIAFKIYDITWIQAIGALTAGVISFVLAGKAKPNNVVNAITYGLIWVIIGVTLDFLVSMKFNEEIFIQWNLWAGYILVLLAPVLRIKKEKTI